MSPIDASLKPASTGVQGLVRKVLARRGNLVEVLTRASQVMAIRLAGAGLTYASMVFLARWLGPHDFGIYAYVLVIVTLLGLAFSFGLNSSALRFVPSYLARRKLSRLSGFVRQSHGAVLRRARGRIPRPYRVILLYACAGRSAVRADLDAAEPA
jgi:hypothetical protein